MSIIADEGYQHVLQAAHFGKRAYDLKRSGNAQTADLIGLEALYLASIKFDYTLRAAEGPCNEVEQSGLARTIGPNQPNNLLFSKFKGNVMDSGQATEIFGYMCHLKESHGSGLSHPAIVFEGCLVVIVFLHSPTRPTGAKRAMTRAIKPNIKTWNSP